MRHAIWDHLEGISEGSNKSTYDIFASYIINIYGEDKKGYTALLQQCLESISQMRVNTRDNNFIIHFEL